MRSIRELRDRAVIRPVKQAVEDQLLDLPGVTAVDIGDRSVGGRRTGEQVIVVSVRRKRPADQLSPDVLLPGDVLGIPVDVIEEEPALHHLDRWVAEVPEPSGVLRSGVLAGGAGISPGRSVWMVPPQVRVAGQHRRVGTLGAVVVGHSPTTVIMGLTTFDVACADDAWSVGDRMIDPDSGAECADLARAALSGRVDAAAVTLVPEVAYSRTVSGIGAVTGQSTAYPGEIVRKFGYGTAFSEGIVLSTDTTLRLDHGDALGVRVLREQLRVRAISPVCRFAGRGDAGAVLLNTDNRVVGLHLAGNRDGSMGFASPIVDVLAELDVELAAQTRQMSR